MKAFSVLFLSLLWWQLSNGQMQLREDVGRLTIENCYILVDVDRELELADVLQKSGQFQLNEARNPNLGLSRNSVWVKFSVENVSDTEDFLFDIAYPLLDEVDLYSIDSSDNVTLLSSMGGDRSFNERRYPHPNYIFDLVIPRHTVANYLLRIKSTEQIILPMTINKPLSLWETLNKQNLFLGIYIGVILIMAVYNFFLYLSILDRSYIYYVFYVIGTGITQVGIKGFNFQYLWPHSPHFEQYSVIAFASISCIAALLFTIKFLGIREVSTRLYKILLALIVVFVVSLFVLLFDTSIAFVLMQSATTIFSFTVLFAAIYVVSKRSSIASAKFFLVAWSTLLTGSIIFLLKDYQVLPYTTLTNYSMQIASAIEMALLSFGLANRINILKREKEESQLQAIAIAKENEQLIREQNVVLERRVEERTHALQESNDSLQRTLAHLKETQTQLVEAEKMASLGQLTAGVAHEINNPINFVTSNVAPLKRDVAMVWEAVEEVGRIALADGVSLEEKERRIRAYKDEIDMDYLKTEIEFLLKGMHEGATRTAEIVKSLRVFSRVDEESLKFADINEGLDSTLVILNSLVREGITVKKKLEKLPPVECYPGKLNQVFLNIITNGIYAINKKFNGEPGGVLEIETTADSENAYITISDNGIGMSDEVKEKMFEPFFTTKEVGEGTGLGMSIVYNTIRKHQGEIKIESAVGEGVSFIIMIPLTQPVQ